MGVPKPKAKTASALSRQVSVNSLFAPTSASAKATAVAISRGASLSLLPSRAPALNYTVRGSKPGEPLQAGEHEQLLAALQQDIVVPRTAEAKASSWSTWCYYHHRWFGGGEPSLPLTPCA